MHETHSRSSINIINQKKGGVSLMAHFKNRLNMALKASFPELSDFKGNNPPQTPQKGQ